MSDTLEIHVTDQDGAEHTIPALSGWRVMEIIRDAGLSIKAECGGCCSCATCHVYVDEAWQDKLVEPTDEEMDMLDEAFDIEDTSRLSCQIIMKDEFNGLKVTLAPCTEAE